MSDSTKVTISKAGAVPSKSAEMVEEVIASTAKLLKEREEARKAREEEATGEVEGYIFAKICFGEGGHQDNVFHEAAHFADWAHQYGEDGKVYVILIDTDLTDKFDRLKFNYDSDNVWVVDHVEFQKRLGIND